MLDHPSSWTDESPLVLVTNLCIGPARERVRFVLREDPRDPKDSGWVFFSGLEPEGYNEKPENFSLCPLVAFVDLEPELVSVLDSPVGAMWEKPSDHLAWTQVIDHDPY